MSVFMSVVLPTPLRPTIARISCLSTANERFWRIRALP